MRCPLTVMSTVEVGSPQVYEIAMYGGAVSRGQMDSSQTTFCSKPPCEISSSRICGVVSGRVSCVKSGGDIASFVDAGNSSGQG